jgi:IS1 family transposase
MNYKHLSAKKNKIWLWTSLDKDFSEILEYVVGDRSADTFAKLWSRIKQLFLSIKLLIYYLKHKSVSQII